MRYPRYRMPHHESQPPREAAKGGAQASKSGVHTNNPGEFPPIYETPDSALLIAIAMAHDGAPCGARTLLRDTYPMLDVPERLQRALRGGETGMLEALSPMLPEHLRSTAYMAQLSQLSATLKAQFSAIDSGASPQSEPQAAPQAEGNRTNPMNMLNMLSALGGMNGMGGAGGGGSGMGNMANIANMASMMGNMGGNSGGTNNAAGGGNQMQMMEMLAKMMGNRNNG